jgi:2-polyprenyl-6-methoxyphenol hydroxylase-like FAD-dependent oxidoreductase
VVETTGQEEIVNTRTQRSHAVVIGASMAGVLAARALAEHFERVTIVDRDRLPDSGSFRNGVPQGHHLHVLLVGGRHAIESLLPGFESDLVAAGAVAVRFPQDVLWLTAAGWSRRFEARPDDYVLSISRPLLESLVRRRVLEGEGIAVMDGCEAPALTTSADGRVTGVEVRHRGDLDGSTRRELAADLVVDASGRTSRCADWLEALGYARPEETRIDSFLGYASRQYAPPPGWRNDWKALFLMSQAPNHARTGFLFPIEEGRWIVTLAGAGRDYPPTDDQGFLDFARSLRHPVLHEAISGAEPLTPIHSWRHTENRRRHFERLRRWPHGLIALGDAACAFNPIYGQGMSVAAQTAVALDRELREADDLDRLTQRFKRTVAARAAGAWLLATGEDLRYPTTEGSRVGLTTKLTHRYLDRVVRAATADPAMNRVFLEVLALVRPPASLFHPRVAAAALRRHEPPQRVPELPASAISSAGVA